MAKKKTRRAKPASAAPAVAEPAPITTPAATPVVEEPTPETQEKKGHKLFLGAWAYVIGLIVAVAAAIFRPDGLDGYTILVLGVFGIIVGLMNITDEEVLLFLVASLAFIVSTSSMRVVLADFVFFKTLMSGIIIFTATGAFVVSFKALFKVAKNE